MSINKVILVGNVGKDPVVRYFDKGVAKATFPLATSETYTNQQGETITSTEWHNIVIWRALAEVAEKTVKKGSQLYIIGKIRTRSYVDKDGLNKYITEILADTMIVLEKKQVAGGFVASDHGKNDVNGKNQINEPSGAYTPSAGTSLQGKDNPTESSADPDSMKNNGPITSQNEDDLPF